jgi:hypothetical protein
MRENMHPGRKRKPEQTPELQGPRNTILKVACAAAIRSLSSSLLDGWFETVDSKGHLQTKFLSGIFPGGDCLIT